MTGGLGDRGVTWELVRGTVRSWAANRPDVHALGLAGSRARNAARPDSDADLVVVTDVPDAYLGSSWVRQALPEEAVDIRTRRWGVLLERRFRLAGGLEVEFGFVDERWAAEPLDPRTVRVVRDGFVVLYDPRGLLERLVETVGRG